MPIDEGKDKTYRLVHAVHATESMYGDTEDKTDTSDLAEKPTKFIGLIALKSLDAGSLALGEAFTLPIAAEASTLTLELAYQFLPAAWGKGYAAESVKAVFQACKKASSVWAPFSKLYIRAIVNEGNPASLRVMEKSGMSKVGVYEWTGKIYLAGEWRERDNLHIFGTELLCVTG